MPDYSVRLDGDDLIFSAAHFILLPDGICEPLHGHNYRVAVEIAGPLDDVHCVVDFIALGTVLKSILRELDHAVLLPRHSPVIRVKEDEGEVEVTFPPRRWIFPAVECRILPLAGTTVELMARYLAERLIAAVADAGFDPPTRLRVEVEESPGRRAICDVK